ncbi:MAG TPA: hypothetical protein VMV10_01650 [Pirellulales bacterium]|nr:hypothetical protein [Pirellulales bacterium]
MKTGDALVSCGGAFFRHSLRIAALGSLCLALPLLSGCGGGTGGPQGKVSGKVTYNGSPIVTGATVSFLSEGGGGSAAGTVGADGSYQLRSMNGDRIPAGTYKVMITPPVAPTLSPEEAMKASMPGENAKTNPVKGPEKEATIPDQYRSVTTTPAKFDVKEGDNAIDIVLQDKK